MPQKNDREYRSFQLDIAEGEEKVVRGNKGADNQYKSQDEPDGITTFPAG